MSRRVPAINRVRSRRPANPIAPTDSDDGVSRVPPFVTGGGLQIDLGHLTDEELLDLWGRVMAVLRIRGIVRSSNSPIADFAETLVAKLLNLSIVAGSNASYDAVAADGKRYQIKARRVTKANPSRQLSAIRNLDKGGFDFLVAVVFDESGFKPKEVWRFPIDLVREHARYRAHVNAHILFVSGAILADSRSERLV